MFEKQFAARFFRPNAYILACTLSQVPFTLIEVLLLTEACLVQGWLRRLTTSRSSSACRTMWLLKKL